VQVLDDLTGAVDVRRSRLFELLRSTTAALAMRRPTVRVIDAQHVHRRSGGVPLFREKVLAAEAAGTTGVRDHLRDIFRVRVQRLGAPAARAVEVVTVVGELCGDRLVGEVLEADPTTVATALDRAVAADVLATVGRCYRMRHELLREAVYDSLSPARPRHLHARVAKALAAGPKADAAALANLDAAALAERVHLAADAPMAVRARVLAGYGWYLSIASQPDDAKRWSQQALALAEESSDSMQRCRAFLAWGNARVETEDGLAALRTARDLAIA